MAPVSRYGSWGVRTPGQLEQWFRLAELEPDDGALIPGRPGLAGGIKARLAASTAGRATLAP